MSEELLEEFDELQNAKKLLLKVGLTEYQATILSFLLLMGESKASTLYEVSNVPSAKVYETLNELGNMGLVKIRPGRPTIYLSIPPERIMETLINHKKKELEDLISTLEKISKEFSERLSPIYDKSVKKGHTELLRIVKVGKPSEGETRRLFANAKTEINIFSKVMEYAPKLIDVLEEAANRGVKIKIILLDRDEFDPERQKIAAAIEEILVKRLGSSLEIKFSPKVPLRGCIVDSDNNGGCIFLSEELEVPLFLREAAVSENQALVSSLKLFFDLIWKHVAD